MLRLALDGHRTADSTKRGNKCDKGYKLCSILPTLLMTLLRRFCRSRRRLYQPSDSEVTRPATQGGRLLRLFFAFGESQRQIVTAPQSALQGPPIHPLTKQRAAAAMQGAACPIGCNSGFKCLAQGHDGLGGSRIRTANPSVIAQPVQKSPTQHPNFPDFSTIESSC